MMGLGPLEMAIICVVAWLLFRSIGGPPSFGAIPVKPVRKPIPRPKDARPETIIQDESST
jgi:hypothetical protein